MDIELTARIIISTIVGVIAIPLLIIAYRQHKEKGLIFTNKWLYASQKERENMDLRIKKAEYRVGRNVFLGLGILVLFLAFYFLLDISWLFYTGIAIMIILVIYAIYQWMTNERLEKLIENETKEVGRDLIECLIDKIEIGGRQVTDGTPSQEVRIFYKYVGESYKPSLSAS